MLTRKVIKMKFSREQVWGAAAAAFRINGTYINRDSQYLAKNTNTDGAAKKLNIDIFNHLLTSNEGILPEDIALGEEVRIHFSYKLADILAGSTNDFIMKAVTAATMTEFDKDADKKYLNIIPCMPNSAARSNKYENEQLIVDEYLRHSTVINPVLNKKGTQVLQELEIEVINFREYVPKMTGYKDADRSNFSISNIVTAVVKNSGQVVFFFTSNKFTTGETVKISAKVKDTRGNATKLNYVVRKD
jgi:hypothetical protein